MTVKSLRKQLAAAIAMTLVATVALGSSTYAWFATNTKVEVTGMNVQAEVSDNLLIADSSAGTGKAADSTFKTVLNQNVTGLLNPTSTISAAKDAFYYTYDATADGAKNLSTEVEPYVPVAATGDNAGKVSADGGATYAYDAYKDYVFELKAINGTTTTEKLVLTKLNLIYDGIALSEHAYRVAIFTQEESGSGYAALADDTAADAIFAPASFVYFDNKAVKSTTEKDAVNPVVNAGKWSIDVDGTKYYKITVRLWLEGEDTDCYTSKFATLNSDWRLELGFQLVSATEFATVGVSAIGSVAVVTATAAGNTITGPAANAITGDGIAAYQWYSLAADGTESAISGEDSQVYTATANGSYYCVVTTDRGATYRTNTIVITGN